MFLFECRCRSIANDEMPMPRFPNGFLIIYQGPFTLVNFQMAASKPSKIRPLPA